MKLDENYSLQGKPSEWRLEKHEATTNSKGEAIVSRDTWHHVDIRTALKRYVSETLKPSDDAKQIIAKLDEIDDLIKNLKVKQ